MTTELELELQPLANDFVAGVRRIVCAAARSALEPEPREPQLEPERGSGIQPKRIVEDSDSVGDRILQIVMSNPGLRIDQISAVLGTTTKALALPIRQLVDRGDLFVKWQGRSTTYYPGKRHVQR